MLKTLQKIPEKNQRNTFWMNVWKNVIENIQMDIKENPFGAGFSNLWSADR